MKVTFRAFATLREIIGEGEKTLILPQGEKISGLLDNLCKTYPGLREHLFDRTGQIKPYFIILKNGRNVMSLQQLDTVIDENDVIAAFPPVAGG
ncbi:MAG: ubiquitin-like small modifier protein 1 [Thermodesulfobacteriota bacterium]